MTGCFKLRGPVMDTHPMLTEAQQHKEVHCYKPYRYVGYLSSFIAVAFTFYALTNSHWLSTRETGISIGIWQICHHQFLEGAISSEEDLKSLCQFHLLTVQRWQSAIIGLLMFSLLAGVAATIMTSLGVFSLSLSKKVYYYHSAGEIFFICGLCSLTAMIVYTVIIQNSKLLPDHSFGIGYYLAWVMPGCYFISTFCMTMDDIIYSMANEWCGMCYPENEGNRRASPAASAPAQV
ncbi:hypothetical protein EB796_008367 [Bugula neritina]|uniref:Uncharacterized protein n=1 Tax=Bugula neritina TaxID=10212 RepID=A0A7J7K6Z7_BUGNE|nr:hypothetical protein EB796_008367 [Bugula neritina]